jgi:hypothetical protein
MSGVPASNVRRRLLVIPLVVVLIAGVGVVWAYWSATTTAGSNGAAGASTVNAGATPTAVVSGAHVTLSWAATTLTSGQAVSGYQIKRYNASNQSQSMLSACAGTITALTCTENTVPTGTWTYTVTPTFATNWLGGESAKSTAVATDATAPSNVITVTGVTGGASRTGDIVYYRGSAVGSFTLTNAVTDADSGPASSSTAMLGGTSTGWTHTPSTVSTPAAGPYVSSPFSWTAATTTAPTQVITGRDVRGNTAATTLAFTNDSTAPVAGAISYPDGVQPGSSVSVTLGASSDAASGVASRQLQRADAVLSGGTCGAYSGGFQNLGVVNPTSPYVDTAVSSGFCYMYRHLVTDAVGNQAFATSASVARISSDVTGPSGGSVTATGLTGGYSLSTTLNLTLNKGADPSGLAPTGARLMRASAFYTGTGGGTGTCGTFGGYIQVGADDPTSPRADTVADAACYRYQYVVGDNLGNKTTYTSIDIRVDTTPNGAHWGFNEGAGSTSEDTTGNGNTATLHAGASWTGGRVGSHALRVTGAVDSLASTPHPVIDTAESYTVAGWVNFTTLTGNHAIASIEGTTQSPFYLKRDGGAGGFFQFAQLGADTASGGTWAFANSTTAPVVGTWYHVAGVYNKATNRIQLYVNGNAQAGNVTAAQTWKAQGRTLVGQARFGGVPNNFTNGAIDAVRFYPSALTATQISALAGDTSGPTGGSVSATGLVGTESRYSTSTTINLSLATGTDSSGVATSGNLLRRATGTLTGGVCGAYGAYALVATDPGATFSEAVAGDACYAYRYQVFDTVGYNNIYASGDIKVDATAPATPTLAFSALTEAVVTGGTVFYRSGAASGGFTVTAAATDAQSGIASYAFPALGTNWASTPGPLGVNTYSWSGATTAPGTRNVTATNNASGTSANAPLTVTADNAAPSTGSVTYADTTQSGTTISVGFTTGTDSGSGIGSRLLMRASATLNGATCESFGSFTTIVGGDNPAGSPVVDAVTGGRCYKYQYVVTDKLGNLDTATSGSIVKVSAPCATVQLLQNPSFEDGLSSWTQSVGGIVSETAPFAARTGTWNGWMGGWGIDMIDTLTQQVSIPANCSASLSYWLRIETSEDVNAGVRDTFLVEVTSGGNTSQVGPTYSNADAGPVYVLRTVDLSAYAGQNVTLRFVSHENLYQASNIYFDDVALTTGPIG